MRPSSGRAWPPVVYGHPEWIESYLAGVAKVLRCQPEEVFADDGVRRAGGELTALIERCVSLHGDGGAVERGAGVGDGVPAPSPG